MTTKHASSILLLFVVAGLTVLTIRCEPLNSKPQAGFGGNGSIHGIVTIDDTLSGKKIPLAGAVVRIGFNNSDTTTFQYSVKTNAGGYYEFQYLQEDAMYYLSCLYTRTNRVSSVQYVKMDQVTLQKSHEVAVKDLPLEPKGGLFSLSGSAQIMDVLTGQTRKQSGIAVTLKRQANPIDPYGYTVLTDTAGNFKFYNLTPEKYSLDYQYATKNGDDALLYTASNSFTTTLDAKSSLISALPNSLTVIGTLAGFNIGTGTLKLVTQGDLILVIQDEKGVVQPNLAYCLYANEKLFDTYTKCENSLASGITNRYGRALIRNLAVNTMLYIRVYDAAEKSQLFTESTIITKPDLTTALITVK